jgi:hypothetical protein
MSPLALLAICASVVIAGMLAGGVVANAIHEQTEYFRQDDSRIDDGDEWKHV